MSKERVKLLAPDVYLMATVLALVVVGILLVFDASYAKAGDLKSMRFDIWYMVKRQAMFAALGLVCMFALSRFPYSWLRKITKPLIYIAFAALALVLIFGHLAHGSMAWFSIFGFTIQPSEFAKVAIVMYLALQLSRPSMFSKRCPDAWIKPALVCAAAAILVVAERDLGTAAVIAALGLAMFFAAGARRRYVVLVGLLLASMAAATLFFVPHCKPRLEAWLRPWENLYNEGYQTVHALAGLGAGGWRGQGLCEGREKFYMPASSTDYVFVTLGEEAGLIGGVLLIGGFALLTYRGLHIAQRASSPYGGLLATGVSAMVTLQALTNLAVVTALMPATGLPLPLISYGGSSMVSTLMCAGILLSVSRQLNVASGERDSYESDSDRRRDGRSHIPRSERRPSSSRTRSTRRAAVRR